MIPPDKVAPDKVKDWKLGNGSLHTIIKPAFLLAPCTSTICSALPLSGDNAAERAERNKVKPGPQPTSSDGRAEGDRLLLNESFTERGSEQYDPLLEVPQKQATATLIDCQKQDASNPTIIRNSDLLQKPAQQHSSTTTIENDDVVQASKNMKLDFETDKFNDIDVESPTTNQKKSPNDSMNSTSGNANSNKPISLRCFYTNASCIMNKRDELLLLVEKLDPDIIGISESWCGDSVLDGEVHMQGYNLYREDKKLTATGGGLLLYFRDNLQVTECHDVIKNDFESSLWCDVKLSNSETLLVGLCYRSPNSAESNNDKLLDQLRSIDKLNRSHILVFGDFNFKEIKWVDGYVEASDMHLASLFYDVIQDLYLIQHVTKPTRYREGQIPSLLNLILANEEPMIDDEIEEIPPIGKSDHVGLFWTYICKVDI